MEIPTQQVSYEILDPTKDSGRELTSNREVAEAAYNRGFLVSEHEIVKAHLSVGRSVTTIITTDWRTE